jgi:hypothetical protein
MFFLPKEPLPYVVVKPNTELRIEVEKLRAEAYRPFLENFHGGRLTDRWDDGVILAVQKEERGLQGTIRVNVGYDLPANAYFELDSDYYNGEISKFAVSDGLSSLEKYMVAASLIKWALVALKLCDVRMAYLLAPERTASVYTKVCQFESTGQSKLACGSKDPLTLYQRDFSLHGYERAKLGNFFIPTEEEELELLRKIRGD